VITDTQKDIWKIGDNILIRNFISVDNKLNIIKEAKKGKRNKNMTFYFKYEGRFEEIIGDNLRITFVKDYTEICV